MQENVNLVFCSIARLPPALLLVGSFLIEKVFYYKLLGVHLSDNLTWNEHVTHIVKKGSKRLYALRALKKCGLTDRQSILVYCSIIRSVLKYASPVWAGLMQYLSDHIESVQKRTLRIIFPTVYYEEALKKSGFISLRLRREDACITFLKFLFFPAATQLSAAYYTHTQNRMPLEQENLFLCLPVQERTDSESSCCVISAKM